MKKLLLTLVILLTATSIYSQGRYISAYYGMAENALIRYQSLDGAASYNGKGTPLIGIRYRQSISNTFDIEAGAEYVENRIEITPAFYPGIDMTPRETEIELVSFPVFLRHEISKHLFIHGGPLIDVEINRKTGQSTDNQSGLGFGLGLGGRLPTGSFEFFIDPFINLRAILPFEKDNHHQHLLEAGVKLGVGYRL
ncbi:MAG: hypothetical protein ACLFPE_15675 [Bacteroidales bacterium]